MSKSDKKLLSELSLPVQGTAPSTSQAAAPLAVVQHYAKVQKFSAGSCTADAAAALCCAASVAPLVAIVDVTIMMKAKGLVPSIGSGLLTGIKTLATRPVHFVFTAYRLPVATVLMVYGGTYLFGNVAQSYCESLHRDYKLQKFLWSSGANLGLTIVKDILLLKSLSLKQQAASGGAVTKPPPVPLKSKGLMLVRDSITVSAGFIAPPMLAEFLESRFGWEYKRALDFSFMFCPVSAQLLNAHFHLVAVRWQDHPHESFAQCARKCNSMFLGTVGARMLRIMPSYGFGGMINVRVRDSLQKRADPSLAEEHKTKGGA
jgi:hypothetical protein